MSPLKTGTLSIGGRTELIDIIQTGAEYTFDLNHRSVFASDASFCSKKSAIHMATIKGAIGDTSSASSFYFAIGTAVHEIIDKAIKPVSMATELSVRHPIGINGRIDNIILDNHGNVRIVDTKTCGKLPIKAKPSHVNQVATYALISGIRYASILYFSRSVATWNGELQVTEIPVILTDELLLQNAKVMAESVIFTRDKVIPQWTMKPYKSHCGWCNFKDLCWGESVNDIEANQVLHPTKSHWNWIPVMTPELMERRNKAADLLISQMDERFNLTLAMIETEGNEFGKKIIDDGEVKYI